MVLCLNTANLGEIREIADWGVLCGITTDPSLIVKGHLDFRMLVKKYSEMLEQRPLTDSGLEKFWQIGKLPERE